MLKEAAIKDTEEDLKLVLSGMFQPDSFVLLASLLLVELEDPTNKQTLLGNGRIIFISEFRIFN